MKLFKQKPLPEDQWIAEKRILVHFKNNQQSIEGYLVRQTENHYYLSHAKLLDVNSRELDMEGIQLIPKRDLLFVQVLAENWAL